MQIKLIRLSLNIGGLLLFLVAVAKLISATGHSKVLHVQDPIFRMEYQKVFLLVGAAELALSVTCLASRRIGLKAVGIAWLSTNFVAYRLGLIWVGWHKPCLCLGSLTDVLPISPLTADLAMKIVLAYLLVSSYFALLWLLLQRWRGVRSDLSIEPVQGWR